MAPNLTPGGARGSHSGPEDEGQRHSLSTPRSSGFDATRASLRTTQNIARQQDVHSLRDEIYRIKEILKEVDTDGSGTMEWDEFVDFFRRAGLLLEYHTEYNLNRTTLCSEMETQRLKALEKEDTFDKRPRR